MDHHLLSWGAHYEQPEWLQEHIAAIERDESVEFDWSCGGTRRIQVGDRAFLLRQRMEPRGLVGLGTVIRSPYLAPHWNETHKQTLYVMVRWE